MKARMNSRRLDAPRARDATGLPALSQSTFRVSPYRLLSPRRNGLYDRPCILIDNHGDIEP